MARFFIFALLILSQPHGAQAGSEMGVDEQNGLISPIPLEVGETLRFPRGFRLAEFKPELGKAVAMVSGSEGGKKYACAFAIDADSEVKFPEYTHWTVIKNEVDGDVRRLALAHDTWGALRPLEFRCVGAANVNTILMGERIMLPVEVPVEHVSD